MRDILFRGKRTDNGEWVYGDLITSSDGKRYAINPHWKHIGKIEVLPETVGQYTGLTDTNGKKIFDGDVLHIHSACCDYDFRTSVGAKYGYVSGFYVDGSFDGGDFNEIGFAMDFWSNEDAEVEVIDNIHDNPELKGA